LAAIAASATFGSESRLQNQELILIATRRQFSTAAAIVALAGGGIAGLAVARPAKAETESDQSELAKAGPDGDVVLGSDKAPVTVIEYASLTCPHCAHFSATTFPALEKRYIDTGKVRFIFREFPLDALAAAGFMLARCAGKDKFIPIIETLFAKQPEWLVKEPLPALRELAKQFGFTQESFDACLANQKVLDGIQVVRDRAVSKLGVNSTPTFFVNGKKLVGDQSIDSLAKEIDPYLKAG
jgi:protein-disulfide isomerase